MATDAFPRMKLTVERIASGDRLGALRELEGELKELAEKTQSQKLLAHVARAWWITKGLLKKEGEL